jgi:outer membrane protein assembly factor BamC
MNSTRAGASSMEIRRVSLPLTFRAVLAGLLAVAALAGCTTVENLFNNDKVDYRSASATRNTGLEVPPDLTQLSRESRYQLPPSGSISATTFQAGAVAAAAPAAAASGSPMIAPQAIGAFRLERLGNERWLSTTQPPEDVYPLVRAFWKDNGFNLVEDRSDAGVLETDWAENRAKLPGDFIRNTIGKVFDNAYSTGELDKYRTRIERTASGCDIYITHRGMVEVYTGQAKENTVWQARPADPQLEAEFLSRLMVRLGAKEEQAKGIVATATSGPAAPAHARLLADRPGPTLQVDDNFDRAWRRVGIALDRSGFTVEDRDRTQGIYFVRYVDPKFAGRDEPNFFSRLLSFGRKKADDGSPVKYRVKVTGEGTSSSVAVQDSTGKPENSDNGKRIASLLLDDLK